MNTITRKLLVLSLAFSSGLTTVIAEAQNLPAVDIPLAKQQKPTETTAAVIRRKPPNFPSPANRSGFCCVSMDVTTDGYPENIEINYCSEEKFTSTTAESLKEWLFNPAIVNGKPVKAYNQQHIVTYSLLDEQGRVIPDRKGLILKNGKIEMSQERLCKNPTIG